MILHQNFLLSLKYDERVESWKVESAVVFLQKSSDSDRRDSEDGNLQPIELCLFPYNLMIDILEYDLNGRIASNKKLFKKYLKNTLPSSLLPAVAIFLLFFFVVERHMRMLIAARHSNSVAIITKYCTNNN
jgi:hypothetical protein